jgi:23S rRNA (guanosine2251-2'-O)-methyltransferase
MKHEKIYIYGKHALMEALRNSPKAIDKVYLENRTDKEIEALVSKLALSVGKLSEGLGDGVERGAKHQGVIGRVALSRLVQPLGEFMTKLKVTPDTALVVLGEIQDPQNVGAIIRSAAAFGISGILIPEHNQAPVTGAVVKVSAGMAFRIPLVSIGNVNDTLRILKDKGFWIYGLAGGSKQTVQNEKFEEPAVFVLGNESTGIRHKTLEHCDIPLSIPMNPQCESLNVAASAAVVLYTWSGKHPSALK